jgi:ABC-type multidrug transport system ATPase subunit
LLCYCHHPASRMKQVTFEDNDGFFGTTIEKVDKAEGEELNDDGESSEVA